MRRSSLILPILIAVAVSALLTGCFQDVPHPPAQRLIRNFQKNQADFEHLLQMFQEDQQLGRVAYDFTRPAEPGSSEFNVPPERLDAYRALFDRLGLKAGVEGYGDKRLVYFIASTRGLSVSGSGKGYAYSVDPPDLVVEDIDAYWSEDCRSFTAYQHIDGKWYLYFDYED